MRQIVTALVAGLIFGIGLCISGLANPAKVLNFLDVAGTWDPSLLCVMAGAAGTTALGYRLVLRRQAPLLGGSFQLPTSVDIDWRLAVGAAIFGIGWGLCGICPGPAVVALTIEPATVGLFVLGLVGGMMAFRGLSARP